MWKFKVLIQFILAVLPGGERVNYIFQRLTGAHSPERIGTRVISLCRMIKGLERHISIERSTVLEIGTGWDAINPLVFYLMGAKVCHTYDHVSHVRYEMVQRVINQMESSIEQIQSITSLPIEVLKDRITNLKTSTDLEELFEKANIICHAPADATRTDLADGSVDIVYSCALLEHVPVNILHDLTTESKRVLRYHGIAFHSIGLHDHYVSVSKSISKVNFLKYSERVWSFFVNNKISYTNRLREKEYIDIFESHGAVILSREHQMDPSDIRALKTMEIDQRFSGMAYEQLAVYYSEMILSFSPPQEDV